MFYSVIKLCFVLLLLFSFLLLMAWPSLLKFLAGGVIIEVSRIPKQKNGKPQLQELKSPALTFCAKNYSSWKDGVAMEDITASNVAANCGNVSKEEVMNCIQQKTFSINDTVISAFHDLTNPVSVMNEKYWTRNFGCPFLGMCHTFIFPTKLKADMLEDGVIFQLNPELSYKVIIHDPKYYLMASNPLVFPRIWREYKAQDIEPNKFEWLYISETDHKLLNRPEQPCEENPSYDYITCVKNSQARDVGCRPAWDHWSDPSIPVCTNMEDLVQHEALDWGIYNFEQKIVENKTGCKVPCKYKEFAIAGEPQGGSASPMGNKTEKYELLCYSTLNILCVTLGTLHLDLILSVLT